MYLHITNLVTKILIKLFFCSTKKGFLVKKVKLSLYALQKMQILEAD